MRFFAAVRDDFRAFEQRTGNIYQPARRLVAQLAKEAKAEARTILRGPRSGRRYGGGTDRSVYRVGAGGKGRKRAVIREEKTFRAYTASAAGEPPAKRTGVLLRSVRAARVKGKRGLDRGFTFFVFADRRTAFYQRFLEFGVKRRGIAIRPLFGPLAEKYARRLSRELPDAIEQGLRSV